MADKLKPGIHKPSRLFRTKTEMADRLHEVGKIMELKNFMFETSKIKLEISSKIFPTTHIGYFRDQTSVTFSSSRK